jgi:predicted ferric reductase
MNIDERLAALAQTVELLYAMQRDNEKRFEETDRRFAQVTRNFEITLDSIKRLENIAVAHEQRLDDIQGP